jgi:cytochrome c551
MEKVLVSNLLSLFGWILISCLAVLTTCTSEKRDASNKFTQYYNQGGQLYEVHCSNCHQKNGAGLGKLFPPLNTSDYLDKNFNEVICLIKNGKNGPLLVNGVQYNKEMPAIQALTDLEIAEITTYIYNTWGRQRGIVEVKEASLILEKCQALFPKN